MNISLQNSIKMAFVRYSLNAKYNTSGNRNKNSKILKAILENDMLGNIEFNTGKICSKGGINYMIFLRSTEHNYSIKFYSCKYYLNLKLENNILIIGPKEVTTVRDNFEDYTFNLNDCIIKLYLSKEGLKNIKKFI
jgi:hypothetical protein